MQNYDYEDVIPTPIKNAKVKLMLKDGSPLVYQIYPESDCILHDRTRDWYDEYDNDGNGLGQKHLGYTSGSATCSILYDFQKNEDEYYVVTKESVNETQIF